MILTFTSGFTSGLHLQGRAISRLCQRAEDVIAFRESNEDM